MTFSCNWCSKLYKTTRGLKKHLEGHHNEIAAAAERTTEHPDSSADVNMESDKNAMDESDECEENNGVVSDIYEDQDESIATGRTRRSTRLVPKNAIGIAYTVCVVHAANSFKGLSEYKDEVDILFPTNAILVNGVVKTPDGRRRAEPTHWVTNTHKITPFTKYQLRNYKILVDHRFRLNSPFPNRVCATKGCGTAITWRTAGVLRRKVNANKSDQTMAYLKSVSLCLKCSGL
ncbi:hypothetical protein EC957_001730 [Mortierella hygrophila]|uniref:C2H2-type domain-containing protein n=1 Tax=Mortierella hygrophila TaxID=979708 RepID=A0A9P6F5H1_9FUNG|nr:hypothetical protein EC957_001730 [Mortierella hygrophila]